MLERTTHFTQKAEHSLCTHTHTLRIDVILSHGIWGPALTSRICLAPPDSGAGLRSVPKNNSVLSSLMSNVDHSGTSRTTAATEQPCASVPVTLGSGTHSVHTDASAQAKIWTRFSRTENWTFGRPTVKSPILHSFFIFMLESTLADLHD